MLEEIGVILEILSEECIWCCKMRIWMISFFQVESHTPLREVVEEAFRIIGVNIGYGMCEELGRSAN